MANEEEVLTGGNTAELVVRVGGTVRKPTTAATAGVHGFLRHLRTAGFAGAPEVLGYDEQGRQVLEYIPGPLWYGGQPRSHDDLRRVGALIRTLHGAAATYERPAAAHWSVMFTPFGDELVCHNDLAPWNLVCGTDRWVFIDWDNAAPGTRLGDLAWAAISFAPFHSESDLSTAAAGMHALLEGYGLPATEYGALVAMMASRSRQEYELIVEGARLNEQPWTRLYLGGHHEYWGPVSDYLERHAPELTRMLVGTCGATV